MLLDFNFLLLLSLRGLTPANPTSMAAVRNILMFTPISAIICVADCSLTPGMVWRFFICSWKCF